jgi:LacI family transcriptional regulator
MGTFIEGTDLVGRSKNAGTRVSMQNVAAYAGVSIATVSKVMQGVSTILPENVTKVQNAIEALGYRINPLGAELRRGRRNLVGLIVPTLEEPAIARLVSEMELTVESRGHILFVGSSHQSEKREADLAGRMLDWRVAGVIVLPVKGQAGAAGLLLEDAGLPTVYAHKLRGKARFDTIRSEGKDTVTLAQQSISLLFKRIDHPDDERVVE